MCVDFLCILECFINELAQLGIPMTTASDIEARFRGVENEI